MDFNDIVKKVIGRVSPNFMGRVLAAAGDAAAGTENPYDDLVVLILEWYVRNFTDSDE